MHNENCTQKPSEIHCDCEAKQMLLNIQQFSYLIQEHTKELRTLLEEHPHDPFFMAFLEHSLGDAELTLESMGDLRSFLKSAQVLALSNDESWGPANENPNPVMN